MNTIPETVQDDIIERKSEEVIDEEDNKDDSNDLNKEDVVNTEDSDKKEDYIKTPPEIIFKDKTPNKRLTPISSGFNQEPLNNSPSFRQNSLSRKESVKDNLNQNDNQVKIDIIDDKHKTQKISTSMAIYNSFFPVYFIILGFN